MSGDDASEAQDYSKLDAGLLQRLALAPMWVFVFLFGAGAHQNGLLGWGEGGDSAQM